MKVLPNDTSCETENALFILTTDTARYRITETPTGLEVMLLCSRSHRMKSLAAIGQAPNVLFLREVDA